MIDASTTTANEATKAKRLGGIPFCVYMATQPSHQQIVILYTEREDEVCSGRKIADGAAFHIEDTAILLKTKTEKLCFD